MALVAAGLLVLLGGCGSDAGANVEYTGQAQVATVNDAKTRACVVPDGQEQICGITSRP